MRGGIPKSDAQKKLEGNPGKRPVGEASATVVAVPGPAPASLLPPKGLGRAAKSVWRELAPIVSGMGLLSEADIQEFARLCELTVDAKALRKLIDKHGWLFEQRALDSHGQDAGPRLKKNPAYTMLCSVEKSLLALEDRFGLSPASRARIRVAPVDGKPDEFQELLNRVRAARASDN